ncbi:MAG: HAMP domain-containing sensor histidine kinase, partial [bacterium]
LAGIQGAIEILNENWAGMDDSERYRFLTMIDNDVKRMERLVKRLTLLTKIEITEQGSARTDLAELVGSMVNRYQEAGKDIELECKTGKAMANIAPDMAETLFTNLLENAFTHGKGSPVTVTIQEGPEVSVRDRGPGISEANQRRVFERFFTTARQEGGTGLGLAMVKAIADACEAEVRLESSEKGTEFRVVFRPASKESSRQQ